MLRKYKGIIYAVLAIIIAVAILLCVSYFTPVRVLPKSVKDQIQQEFEKYDPTGRTFGVTWYDEYNSWDEKLGIYKYMGKYGDCYAFLVRTAGPIGPALGEYIVNGLASEVYFPAPYYMEIILYHTKQDYTLKEIYGKDAYGYIYFDVDIRCHSATLTYLQKREEWISDYQLERLTQDVEKIAESFK